MLDDDDDDLPVPTVWELERIPKRPCDPRRKQRLLADAELYTRLSAQYGPQIFDHGLTARAIVRAITSWFDDCDLWLEATGQDPIHGTYLRKAERLALECWLWETHDRLGRLGSEDPQGGKKGARNPDRWKLKKSPDHDRPWPGARNWAPRRWFGPSPSGKPLTISTSRAVGMREQLDDKYADEVAWDEGAWLGGVVQVDPKELPSTRNHPSPGGSWSVAKVGGFLKWAKKLPKWEPCSGPLDVRIWEVEPKHPHRQLRCDVPIWQARYEPEIDVDPPQSVLDQTHKPPREPPTRIVTGRFRVGYTHHLSLQGPLLPRIALDPAKTIDVQRYLRPQRRPQGAQYTLDLIWLEVRTDIPRSLGAGAYLFAVPNAPRSLVGERLRSPYESRGFPSRWRHKGAKGWAASTLEKRPGAWALHHVEAPANALSAKREECRRRREAATDGLLSNFAAVA
jgi:hypothetical protein